jgi:putative DNA primase/helicase
MADDKSKRRPKTAPAPTPAETSPDEPGLWKPDDDQIATKIAPTWKGKVAFFHVSWKEYETGVWSGRSSPEIRQRIRQELRTWRKFGVIVNQHKIKSLESMLEDDLSVTDRAIMAQSEEQQRYVNLRNGLFNLDTMKLEPHRPDLYLTTQLNFDYDEDALCPTFNRYMRSSLVYPDTFKPDDSLYKLVMEAMGYSMTARTDLKASFWLVGQKDSGKSTFIALLKGIMGTLHTTIDLNQLGVNRFLLSGIVGKRIITFTESSSNTVLPDALYKTLTGGSDEVYADVKNHDPITFRPEAKVWWAMNEMPRIVDRSGATIRRIYIIPFNRSIPENERVQNLEACLMKERSGIFNEMVTHYIRLQRIGGFEYCEQSEDRRKLYIAENDTEATFVEECCDCHESYRIQTTALHTAYTIWCKERGFFPKNYNQIAPEWRRLGFKALKSDKAYWCGVKLKTDAIKLG